MDQFDWQLLSQKIVEEECFNLLKQISNLLGLDLKEIENKYIEKENKKFFRIFNK